MIEQSSSGKKLTVTQALLSIKPAPVQALTVEQISSLSDKELHAKCKICGCNIRKFQKEFACYLPEVERRRLHRKYGFHSIYEYAGRIAGMNHATVDSIMSVHKKLSDKPILKNLMSESGWGKLKVVAAVATPETQIFWAEKIKEMSKATLVTFMKELRKHESDEGLISGQMDTYAGNQAIENTDAQAKNAQIDLFTNITGMSEPGTGSGTPADVSHKSPLTFRLANETETKLRIFKQRLEKKTREPKDWNEVMKELLEIAADHENCGKKPKIAAQYEDCAKKPQQEVQNKRAAEKAEPKPESGIQTMLKEIKKSLPAVSTRYIPVTIKKYLILKHSGKCAFPGCINPAEINHHTKRFSLHPNHDPDHIVPLCKNHERIAHHGLLENEEQSAEKWKTRAEPDMNALKFIIDQKVQKYRVPA